MGELSPMIAIDMPKEAENDRLRRNRLHRSGIKTATWVKIGAAITIGLLLLGGWELGSRALSRPGRSNSEDESEVSGQGKSRPLRALEDDPATSKYVRCSVRIRALRAQQAVATSPRATRTSTVPSNIAGEAVTRWGGRVEGMKRKGSEEMEFEMKKQRLADEIRREELRCAEEERVEAEKKRSKPPSTTKPSPRALGDAPTTSTLKDNLRARQGGKVVATSPGTTTTSTTSTTPSSIADTTTLRRSVRVKGGNEAQKQREEMERNALERLEKRRQEAQKAQEQQEAQEAQRQEDTSECTDEEEEVEEEEETADEDDEEDEDEQEEEDGDDDLATIDSDGNFDELKERLKKTNAGAVIKFYDSEVDFKNDNAARGLLIMPIPTFCSHREDDTFKGTIERIDEERPDAQLANAFLDNQATAQAVISGRKVKQLVLHPVYDKSNPSIMKYSYGTLTYNAVLGFYRSKPQGRPSDQRIKTDFEELMKKASCPGCDDIGHVIGYLLGGAYDAKNLFLQNAAVNFNMKGFEQRQFNFLVRNEGRFIDYIVEYINGDNVNGVVRYKEVVWHLRYHAEGGLVGELHFTMPNPRGVKEAYFKKKQEAINSEEYAEPEPKLEFETHYGKLPSYIMKHNVVWNELRSNVLEDCNKKGYGIPKFEKKINRNSDGQITLHSIFSNGGKRLEYLYGQFEVEKLFDLGQTKKWRNAHNLKAVGPVKFAEKNALPGDQYGHVLSACLGGSYEDVNMYPQNEEINLDIGSFENGICSKIRKDMEKYKVTVEAMFNFTYASSGVDNMKHPRPESVNVYLRIKNGKQGKWRAIRFDLPNPESVLRPYYEEFARLNQDNFFVGTIPMTKGGQDNTFAQYGFTVPREGTYNRLNNDIVCPVCKRETFGTDRDFLRHLRRHNEYRLKGLECRIPECIYRTDRKDVLQSHMKWKHGDPKLSDVKIRECDVVRKDGENCTFYAYTEKEIKYHKEVHTENMKKFQLSCPVSTACPFMADTAGRFKGHIKRVHEKPEEQSGKGDPSQAPPSLTGTQTDKEEMFKCPIDGCNMKWPIKESTDFECFITKINRHLENQHRKKDSGWKFKESELKQLAEEERIKDSKGERVTLKPCEKGCLKIFRGDEGRERHYDSEHRPTCVDEASALPGYMKCPVKGCTYCLPTVHQSGKCAGDDLTSRTLKYNLNSHLAVKKEEYYEAHRKDRADPNSPEWTDEEKEILKKHGFKPSSDDNKKSFLQVEVLKP